jgi:cell division ATPase FtsA
MFFFKKNKAKTTLILDIGSGTVGAALVSASKDTPPKILFSTRLPVPVGSSVSSVNRPFSVVTETLESVIKTISEQHTTPHALHIFLSSPWSVFKTDVLKLDYPSPTLITHRTVERLTKEAEKKFAGESHASGEIVERRIIQARLNGYETFNPYNKKAKSVEVTFFVSMVASDVSEAIRRCVDRYFHIHHDQISSFSLAAFNAVSRLMTDTRDFVMVDVRGDATDLSLVVDGALTKSVSFAQGKDALIKTVADGLGQSPISALSMLAVALQGAGEPTAQEKTIQSAAFFKQNWIQEYSKAMQEISGSASAQGVFLIVDADTEKFFENILNENSNENNIRLLKHLNVHQYVEAGESAPDIFLALEAIFVTMI